MIDVVIVVAAGVRLWFLLLVVEYQFLVKLRMNAGYELTQLIVSNLLVVQEDVAHRQNQVRFLLAYAFVHVARVR